MIYHYSIINLCGQELGTRINLAKVIAIDEPNPRSSQFDVHLEGRDTPLKLYFMSNQRGAYDSLVSAWEKVALRR